MAEPAAALLQAVLLVLIEWAALQPTDAMAGTKPVAGRAALTMVPLMGAVPRGADEGTSSPQAVMHAVIEEAGEPRPQALPPAVGAALLPAVQREGRRCGSQSWTPSMLRCRWSYHTSLVQVRLLLTVQVGPMLCVVAADSQTYRPVLTW